MGVRTQAVIKIIRARSGQERLRTKYHPEGAEVRTVKTLGFVIFMGRGFGRWSIKDF
jgi:hypothetical protein